MTLPTLTIALASNTLGWILVAIGLLLIARAFLMRRRVTPGCPHCGYDLSSLIAQSSQPPTCPECGNTARNHRHLSQGPLRVRLVVIGALIAASSNLLFAIPRVASAGLIGLPPSFLLVLIHPCWLPDSTTPTSTVYQELIRRRNDGQLWSPAAELWILRTHLAFWPSGRWGVSSAERNATPLPADFDPPTLPNEHSLNTWIPLAQARINRPITIDEAGFRAIGINTANLQIAVRNYSESSLIDCFTLHQPAAADQPEQSADACLIAHRGSLIITPDLSLVAFRVTSSYPTLPGLDATATAAAIASCICANDWVDNGGQRADLSPLGTRVLVLASETTHQQIARFLALGRQPTPSPWMPIHDPSADLQFASWKKLSSLTLPAPTHAITLDQLTTLLSHATGLSITIDENFFTNLLIEPERTLVLNADHASSLTARDALDRALELLRANHFTNGGPEAPTWTISPDGSIRIARGTDLVLEHTTHMIYDLSAQLDQRQSTNPSLTRDELRTALIEELSLAASPSLWVINGGATITGFWAADRYHLFAPFQIHMKVAQQCRE
ncbi:MAG: hypothetical protein NTV94_02695 [Planctomycetota bacterium]|nr:hypothetical protein [Planctomycetota bacterium]